MASVQIRDILDSIRHFYGQLSDRFRTEQQSVKDESLSWLLEYLSAHELELKSAITRYKDEADEALLSTWLQFGAEDTLQAILNAFELRHGMTAEELVGEALKVDSPLIALYEELAGETSAGHVSELFESLASMQEARERQLAFATL